jgi:hypothetical protein
VSEQAIGRDEQFLKDLYERCRMVNTRAAGWLNGSCRVLALAPGVLELGFWSKIHLENVDGAHRPLIQQQAEAILNGPVELRVTLIEEGPAPSARPARKGHLAEAARELGAVPVQKEG